MLPTFEPIPLHPHEMALLRLGFAYVLYRQLIRAKVPFPHQPSPTGLARWLDLTPLARPDIERMGRALMWVCVLCYALGLALPLVLPAMAGYMVLRETLRNSQGALHHSRQACALVLLVQAAVYLVQAAQAPLSWTSYVGGRPDFDLWAAYGSQQAIAAVYLTAALTKIRNSGWGWVRHAPRITLQIAKSSQQKYYDRLDASFLTRAEAVLVPAQRYPQLTRLAVGGGLALELAAPLMLYGRLTLLGGGLLLLVFHRMNGRFMGLPFREHQALLAVFFLNAPYGIALLLDAAGL